MTATANEHTSKVNHTNDHEAPMMAREVMQTNAFFGGRDDNTKDHHEKEPSPKKEVEPFTLDSKNPTVGEVLQSNAFFQGSSSENHEQDEKKRHQEPSALPKEGEPFTLDSKNPTIGEVLQSNAFFRGGSHEKERGKAN